MVSSSFFLELAGDKRDELSLWMIGRDDFFFKDGEANLFIQLYLNN